MSPEFMAIIAVGVALAGIVLTGQRGLRKEFSDRLDRASKDQSDRLDQVSQDVWDLRGQMSKDVSDLRGQMSKDVSGLRDDVGQLRERMAHLEGLLEGLREAITRDHNRAA